MSKYCWTTLLGTDDFIWGVIGLHLSLKKVQSDYELIVLAVDNLKQETFTLLEHMGITYARVPNISFEHSQYYNCTINKFWAWALTGYDKVCFIDADTVVIQNIDFFFNFTPFSSCVDGDGRVFGALFLLKPNEDFAKQIFERFRNCEHDEEVLNIIYHDQLHKTGNWLPDSPCFLWHDAYSPKYWEMFNLKSIEAIQNFIKNGTYIFYLKYLNYTNPYLNISLALVSTQFKFFFSVFSFS